MIWGIYSLKELCLREKEIIFEKQWFCLDHANSFKGDQTIRTYDLLGESIVITKSDGDIRAFWNVSPFLHFTINVDHIVFFIFHPVDVNLSNVRILWCVNTSQALDEAVKNDLTWLWKNTIRQDIELTGNVQKNASSKFFPTGNYEQLEYDSSLFRKWYLAKLKLTNS